MHWRWLLHPSVHVVARKLWRNVLRSYMEKESEREGARKTVHINGMSISIEWKHPEKSCNFRFSIHPFPFRLPFLHLNRIWIFGDVWSDVVVLQRQRGTVCAEQSILRTRRRGEMKNRIEPYKQMKRKPESRWYFGWQASAVQSNSVEHLLDPVCDAGWLLFDIA